MKIRTKKGQMLAIGYICLSMGAVVFAANLSKAQKLACYNAATHPVTTGGVVAKTQEDCCENECRAANDSATLQLDCESNCDDYTPPQG